MWCKAGMFNFKSNPVMTRIAVPGRRAPTNHGIPTLSPEIWIGLQLQFVNLRPPES